MGYGLTSSTCLVAAGLSPRSASESVHLAQLGTTLVSGLAHHRHGTVDWPTVRGVSVSGVLGAVFGTSVLSSLNPAGAKTIAASILLVLGAYLLWRFYHLDARPGTGSSRRPPTLLILAPIGVLGGFVDATGGGGWGPIATSGLLAEGRLPPSKVIGTVSMSEFAVTVAAVAGFCLVPPPAHAIGGDTVRFDLMLSLLTGGLLAAPIAPILVKSLRPNLMGVVVGGFIVLTNARVLFKAADAAPHVSSAFYTAVAVAWTAAIARVAVDAPQPTRRGLTDLRTALSALARSSA